ncbi:MAG TPA: putative phage abortive infection protein [Bacteroides mediterraneensis]|uniref:putative phage abortive infection protein n=1 Tax=Bacteroides mediterraneensis TaxID=1841856 RepID=UPI0026EF513C|nr:putative phage abortive infection protein [Bacteroides mediterraneensis]HJH64739.1 putative phage abortive infection protein [Bacteroides mediterraneensis]
MKNKTFTKDFWIYLVGFLIIIGGICYLPTYFTESERYYFYKETGTIGDTIGGTMGPFVAIAAAILTFLAFWVQFKANEQQRKDIALERFESNLFQLIQIQEDITNNLQFLAYDNSNLLNKVKISGRQIFKALYEEKDTPLWGIKDDIKEKGIISYEEDKDIGILDHYFRHLYRVFKFIDEAPIFTNDKNKKYDYACIMRASLSQYELIMLFYNCLSSNGREKFKPLIEKYAIFNNLRVELLATDREKELYVSKFQDDYAFSKDENRDMSNEYKKGAFVFNENE